VISRIGRGLVACLLAVMLFPSSSLAQAPAATFDELRRALRPGDQVVVTSTSDRRTRGFVVAVSDTSLDVRARSMFRFRQPGPLTTHAESSIAHVTRVDSLNNGALIGIGIGVGVGIASCTVREDASCGEYYYSPVVFSALVGVLTGMVVDAAIRKTIYRRGTPQGGGASITISPLVNAAAKGASLSVRF
jgi:hypothetical protein